MRGDKCVMKHAQNFHSYCANNNFWKSVPVVLRVNIDAFPAKLAE